MKRFLGFFVLIIALVSFGAAAAQDNTTITLNDATPGIDVMVTMAPNTTGVVALQLSGASVKVTDSAMQTVFQVADVRLHALELRFTPGSGSHTITVERLPGVSQAYVIAQSQLDLTVTAQPTLVSNPSVAFGQQINLPLSAQSPSATIPVTIPAHTTSDVLITFPGAPVTLQLADKRGSPVATLAGGSIDGVSMTLDSGDYRLTMVNTNAAAPILAGVSMNPGKLINLPAAVFMASAASAPLCNLQVTQSSINLRSGPGTGYSVLQYGYQNNVLVVGGVNREKNWLLVSPDNGANWAWMDKGLGKVSGNCTNLKVYDIPFKDAPQPQTVVAPAAPAAPPAPPAVSGGNGSGEHEGNDGNEGSQNAQGGESSDD